MHIHAAESSSASQKTKLVARDASTRDRECTSELAKFLRDTSPIRPESRVDDSPKHKTMIPRSARPEDSQHLREIANFLKNSSPIHEASFNSEEGESSPRISAEPSEPSSDDATIFSSWTTTPPRKGSVDSVLDQKLNKLSRLASGSLRVVVNRIHRLHSIPHKDELKATPKSWTGSSLNSNETNAPQASYGLVIEKAVLHGHFDIPQQYYRRKQSNVEVMADPSYAQQGVCTEDIPLCSHSFPDSHLGSCKILSLLKRYFVLDASGWVIQYVLTNADTQFMEEAFQITADSIVVATDAVPGKLWCLRLSKGECNSTQLQTLPSIDEEQFWLPRKDLAKTDKDMIIIFPDASQFAAWMFTIKEIVEGCKTTSRPASLEQEQILLSRSGIGDYCHIETERASNPKDFQWNPAFEISSTKRGYTSDVERSLATVESISPNDDADDENSLTTSHSDLSVIEARPSIPDFDQTRQASIISHTLFESPSRSNISSWSRGGRLPRKEQKQIAFYEDRCSSSASVISHSLFEREHSAAESVGESCDGSVTCTMPEAELSSCNETEKTSSSHETMMSGFPVVGAEVMAAPISVHKTEPVEHAKTSIVPVDNEVERCATPLPVSCPSNSPLTIASIRPFYETGGDGVVSHLGQEEVEDGPSPDGPELPSTPTLTMITQDEVASRSTTSCKTSLSTSLLPKGLESPPVMPGRRSSLREHTNKHFLAIVPDHPPQLSLPLTPRGSFSDLFLRFHTTGGLQQYFGDDIVRDGPNSISYETKGRDLFRTLSGRESPFDAKSIL